MIKAQEPKKELCSRRVKLAVLASLLVTTGVCVWAVVDATQVSVDATLNLNGDQTGSDADLYVSGQGTGINSYEVGATDCKIDYSQNGKAWERMSYLKNENPGSSMSKTHLGFHNTNMRVLRGALSQMMWNKIMNSTVSPAHEPLVRVECNGEATASLFHAIPITKAYHHKMEVPVRELERNGGLTVMPKNFEPKQFLNDLLSKGLEYDIEVKYTPDDANPFPVQLSSIEVEFPALEYESATPVEEPHQWNIASKAFTVSVTPELISAVIPVSMTANCEQVPVSPYETVDIAGCRLLDRKYVQRFITEVQSGDVGIGLKSLKSNFVSKLIGEDHKLTATVLTDQRFGDLAGDEFAIKQEDQGRHLLEVFGAAPLAKKFHDKLVTCFNMGAKDVRELKSCVRFDAGFIGLYVVGGKAEVGSTGYKENFKVVHATSWTTFGDFALVTRTDGTITLDEGDVTLEMKAVISEKEEVAKMTAKLVAPGSDDDEGAEDLTIVVGGDAAWHFALEDETEGNAMANMKVGGKAGAGDMLDFTFKADWDHTTETMGTSMNLVIGNSKNMTFVGEGEGRFKIMESWEHFSLVLSKYTIITFEKTVKLSGSHEFDASNEQLAKATTNLVVDDVKVNTIQSWNWIDDARIETFSLDVLDKDDKTTLKVDVAEASTYGSNTITSPFKEKLDVKISDKVGAVMTMGAESSMMMSEDMKTMEMMMDMMMVIPMRSEKNIGDECVKTSECKTGYCGSPKTGPEGFDKCMECPSNEDFDNGMEGELIMKLCEGDDVQKLFLSKCGAYSNFHCHKDKVGKKPLGMDIRIKVPKMGYNGGNMMMGVQLLENNDNIFDIDGGGKYDKDNMFKDMDMAAEIAIGSGDDKKKMTMSMDYAFDDWESVKANIGLDDKGKDGKSTRSLFSAEVDVPLTGTYPDAWKASITKAQVVIDKDTNITLTGEVDAGYNNANPTPYFANTGADGMKMTIKTTNKDDSMDELTLALTGDFTPTKAIGNADMTFEIVGKVDGKDCSTWVKPADADDDDDGPITIKASLNGEWDASKLTHSATLVILECKDVKLATIEQAGTYDDKVSNVLTLKMPDIKFGEKTDAPTKVADVALTFTKNSAINNEWIMYFIPEGMKLNADVLVGDFTDFDEKGDFQLNLELEYDIIDYRDRLMLGTDMLLKIKGKDEEEDGQKIVGKFEPVLAFSEMIDWTQDSAELDMSVKMVQEKEFEELMKLNTMTMYDLDKDYLVISNVKLWVGGKPLAFVTVRFGAIEDKPDLAPEIDDALGLACPALSLFNKAVEAGCETVAKACLVAKKNALGQYSKDMCSEWSKFSFKNDCASNIIGDAGFLNRYMGNDMCGKLERDGRGACATPGAKSCLKRCLQCVKASEDGITLEAGKDADGNECSTCEICGKWRKCATFLKRVVSKTKYSSSVPVDKQLLEKIKAEFMKAAESKKGDSIDNAQQTPFAVVEEKITINMKFEKAPSSEQKATLEAESCIAVNAKQNVDCAPATCTLTKSSRLRRLLAEDYQMLITVPESEGMNLEAMQSEIAVVAESNGGMVTAVTSELSKEVTLIMVVTAADESTLKAISKDITNLSGSILAEMFEAPDFIQANGGVTVNPTSIKTEVEVQEPPVATKTLTDLALDEKEKGEEKDDNVENGAGTLTLSAVAVLFSALL